MKEVDQQESVDDDKRTQLVMDLDRWKKDTKTRYRATSHQNIRPKRSSSQTINNDSTDQMAPKSSRGLLESTFKFSYQDYLQEKERLCPMPEDLVFGQQLDCLVEKYCDEWPRMQQLYDYILCNSNKETKESIK